MAEDKKKAATKEVVAEKKQESRLKESTYIMKVTHLSWGRNGNNHFYSEKKPLITEKVMGKYAGTLKIWLKAGWIEEGKYK